jgi:hypothetical protein
VEKKAKKAFNLYKKAIKKITSKLNKVTSK